MYIHRDRKMSTHRCDHSRVLGPRIYVSAKRLLPIPFHAISGLYRPLHVHSPHPLLLFRSIVIMETIILLSLSPLASLFLSISLGRSGFSSLFLSLYVYVCGGFSIGQESKGDREREAQFAFLSSECSLPPRRSNDHALHTLSSFSSSSLSFPLHVHTSNAPLPEELAVNGQKAFIRPFKSKLIDLTSRGIQTPRLASLYVCLSSSSSLFHVFGNPYTYVYIYMCFVYMCYAPVDATLFTRLRSNHRFV